MTDRNSPVPSPLRGTVDSTVTLFGDNGQIDLALSQELGRRGCRTHAVSVVTGWLPSAQHVVCRLDTLSGQRALEGLAGRSRPRANIVAVCERPADPYARQRLSDLCEECGHDHDVSLIWHSPVAGSHNTDNPPLEQLAVSVADEMSAKVGGRGSAFSSRFVDLG